MNSAGIPGPPPDEHQQPDGADLVRRVSVLEMRFDTVLPTLATKADLADLRTELLVKLEALRAEFRTGQEALRADLIKWMAGMLITILLSFVGMFVGLTRTLTTAATDSHAVVHHHRTVKAERNGAEKIQCIRPSAVAMRQTNHLFD